MSKPKLKVGDRVEDEYRGKGTIIYVIKQFMLYLVEYDRKIVGGHNGNGICDVKGKEGHCYYEKASDLKRVEEEDMKETIVIYRDGKETIALFKQDNKVIRKAAARCHPDDTYDFKAGADIAYKRLMGETADESEAKKSLEECMSHWEKCTDNYGELIDKCDRLKLLVKYWKSEHDKACELLDAYKSGHTYTDAEQKEIDQAYRDRCEEVCQLKTKIVEQSKLIDDLKNRVKVLQYRNTDLVNDWAGKFAQLKRKKDTAVHNLCEENANLKEQLSKQKEINKELVDENKKLKAEIGK